MNKPETTEPEHRTLHADPQPRTRGDPIVRSEPKVGRNDPCPCKSGKKYKRCCGLPKLKVNTTAMALQAYNVKVAHIECKKGGQKGG